MLTWTGGSKLKTQFSLKWSWVGLLIGKGALPLPSQYSMSVLGILIGAPALQSSYCSLSEFWNLLPWIEVHFVLLKKSNRGLMRRRGGGGGFKMNMGMLHPCPTSPLPPPPSLNLFLPSTSLPPLCCCCSSIALVVLIASSFVATASNRTSIHAAGGDCLSLAMSFLELHNGVYEEPGGVWLWEVSFSPSGSCIESLSRKKKESYSVSCILCGLRCTWSSIARAMLSLLQLLAVAVTVAGEGRL